MKRIVRSTVALAVALGILAAGPAQAGSGAAKIDFGDNFFDPEEPGPVAVRAHGPEAVWQRVPSATEKHNIREDSGLFRSGKPSRFVSYSPDVSAGTYHYYCDVHGSVLGGMEGSLAVSPAVDRRTGETARVTWADGTKTAANHYEIEYRVAGKKWKTWMPATGSKSLVFGNGSPVEAKPHETYNVRVRSFVSKDPGRKSDWSPSVSFSVAGQ